MVIGWQTFFRNKTTIYVFLIVFYFIFRHEWRFRAVVLRDRFDQNKNVNDLVKAQQLLAEGQHEYDQKRHPNPFQCKLDYLNGIK